MRAPSVLFSVPILLMLLAGGATAEEDMPSVARAVLDSALVAELEDLPGAPLELGAARTQALAQAPALRVAQATVAAAQGEVRREKGSFEPELFGRAERRSDDQPSASFFAGAEVLETESTEAEVGARMTLPLGTEITARLEGTRLETNSTFAALSPQYDTLGELQLRQPLLEGFGAGTRGQLSAAERRLEAAVAQLAHARLILLADVETTYWELFAAGRDYAVQRVLRARAEALLDQARTRREAGLVGPEEVASARVFLAEQEQAIFDRLERMGELSDRLASLMGHRPAGGEDLFRPSGTPPDEYRVESADLLVETALDHNHELQARERELDQWRELYQQARRNALPTLDLLAGIGGRGLGGTPRDVEFGGETFTTDIDDDLGESLEQALTRDFPNWNVGLSFELPLGNRGDGGEKDRLRAEVARVEQSVEAARRDLEERVRAQHRILAHGQQRLRSARDGVAAANDQVRIGILEYENGRTTAFELVRLGADLAQAQQRYSDALVRTARAVAQLRQLTGGRYPDDLSSDPESQP